VNRKTEFGSYLLQFWRLEKDGLRVDGLHFNVAEDCPQLPSRIQARAVADASEECVSDVIAGVVGPVGNQAGDPTVQASHSRDIKILIAQSGETEGKLSAQELVRRPRFNVDEIPFIFQHNLDRSSALAPFGWHGTNLHEPQLPPFGSDECFHRKTRSKP
jgi:hypothetical protein